MILSGTIFQQVISGKKRLTDGEVFKIIDNTSTTPIFGVLANLPDGSVLKFANNYFVVSYTGGDGNDLTLTVVQ